MKKLLVLLVSLLLTVLAAAQSSSNPTDTPSPRLSLSKVHPKMVKLLHEQADDRKEFYQDKSKSEAEIKERQSSEVQDLLAKHRSARAEFSKEKHTADERATFYRGQRDEMATLKTRQKTERRKLADELKAKYTEFMTEQNKTRRELEAELRQSK